MRPGHTKLKNIEESVDSLSLKKNFRRERVKASISKKAGSSERIATIEEVVYGLCEEVEELENLILELRRLIELRGI